MKWYWWLILTIIAAGLAFGIYEYVEKNTNNSSGKPLGGAGAESDAAAAAAGATSAEITDLNDLGSFASKDNVNLTEGTYTIPPNAINLGYSSGNIYGLSGSGDYATSSTMQILVICAMGNIVGTAENVLKFFVNAGSTWATINGYAGSGNVQQAENGLNTNLNANQNDIVKQCDDYVNFLTQITGNPSYKAGSSSSSANSTIKDIATGAKVALTIASVVGL